METDTKARLAATMLTAFAADLKGTDAEHFALVPQEEAARLKGENAAKDVAMDAFGRLCLDNLKVMGDCFAQSVALKGAVPSGKMEAFWNSYNIVAESASAMSDPVAQPQGPGVEARETIAAKPSQKPGAPG